jgi:hypothetical protein
MHLMNSKFDNYGFFKPIDIQQNDINQNDIEHNDTQHKATE